MKKFFLFLLLVLAIVLYLLFVVKQRAVLQEEQDATQETIANEVHITFLDIGQGDATFIEFPSGEQILIDCAIDARILEALGRVMPVYDKEIDYLFITHPDKDHYGGCIDVLARFDVGTIVYTGFSKESDFFDEFISAIYEEDANYEIMRSAQTWKIADSSLHFLYPDYDIKENPFLPGQEKKELSANNSSLVIRLDVFDTSILLTGDAEEEQEEYLVERYGEQLNVDIYKAGHHGSAGSSIPKLLNIVTPSDTIFSAGKDNSYGHPSVRVIKRLERLGSGIWRTDLNGDILVSINKNGYHVETQYTAR